MARNVYSFTKVEQKRTHSGVYASFIGALSIICLVALLAMSFISGGQVKTQYCALAYVSLFASILGFFWASRIRNRDDAYGRMLKSAYYINAAALIFHGVIFILGVLMIII